MFQCLFLSEAHLRCEWRAEKDLGCLKNSPRGQEKVKNLFFPCLAEKNHFLACPASVIRETEEDGGGGGGSEQRQTVERHSGLMTWCW